MHLCNVEKRSSQYDAVRVLQDRQWHTLGYYTCNLRQKTAGFWRERRVKWIGYDRREPQLKIHVETEDGQREIFIHLIAKLNGSYLVFG